MKVVKEDKNKILVWDDNDESTQWFSVKKKSTLHSEESALGPLVLERIVVHLIIIRDKLEGFLFPKLFLLNVGAFSVT